MVKKPLKFITHSTWFLTPLESLLKNNDGCNRKEEVGKETIEFIIRITHVKDLKHVTSYIHHLLTVSLQSRYLFLAFIIPEF